MDGAVDERLFMWVFRLSLWKESNRHRLHKRAMVWKMDDAVGERLTTPGSYKWGDGADGGEIGVQKTFFSIQIQIQIQMQIPIQTTVVCTVTVQTLNDLFQNASFLLQFHAHSSRAGCEKLTLVCTKKALLGNRVMSSFKISVLFIPRGYGMYIYTIYTIH